MQALAPLFPRLQARQAAVVETGLVIKGKAASSAAVPGPNATLTEQPSQQPAKRVSSLMEKVFEPNKEGSSTLLLQKAPVIDLCEDSPPPQARERVVSAASDIDSTLLETKRLLEEAQCRAADFHRQVEANAAKRNALREAL